MYTCLGSRAGIICYIQTPDQLPQAAALLLLDPSLLSAYAGLYIRIHAYFYPHHSYEQGCFWCPGLVSYPLLKRPRICPCCLPHIKVSETYRILGVAFFFGNSIYKDFTYFIQKLQHPMYDYTTLYIMVCTPVWGLAL